ncbi:MAG: riboflavin biosynthesis protein RibF [Planctomycetota bacterium]
MRTTFELRKLAPSDRGAVVSIGVFDGIHLGHRAILAANARTAAELGAESSVVTFRRHPKKVLLGRAPKTLTSLEHRLELFRELGVEHAVALSFTENLRALSVRDFVEQVAVQGLAVRRFVLGFDSKFGRDREGTPELLRELGFEVEIVPEVLVAGRPVSSTAIREAVELGDLAGAERMLGRRVSVLGRVVRGRQLGREIGFPTANLDLHHELHPPPGVYAVRAEHVREDGGRTAYGGVCNIGFRPTVQNEAPTSPLVEVHLFDFGGDLYGERLEVAFAALLRQERRFENLGELTAQIARDADDARRVLGG